MCPATGDRAKPGVAEVRAFRVYRDSSVTNINPGDVCRGPGFCPDRVKSSQFSSGCIVQHKCTVNLCISIIVDDEKTSCRHSAL